MAIYQVIQAGLFSRDSAPIFGRFSPVFACPGNAI
jgi:hypothetical protein